MDSCSLTSSLFSLFVSFLYVGSLYCWPNQTHRDDPKTIKRRFLSVFVTCIISTLIVIYKPSDDDLWHTLGVVDRNQTWNQVVITAILLPLLQTSVLFIGPIVVSLQESEGLRCCQLNGCLDLIFVRNYVIAPITEEFIFRGVLTAVLQPCWSLSATLVISSLEFGFAHSHHYFFTQNHSRRVNGWAALEQMVYTSFFGMYASLLYFKTRLIVTPILVHSFCNFMGLPDFQTISSSTSSLVITVFGLLAWILSLIYVAITL